MIEKITWWIAVIGALNIGIVNAFGKDFLANLLGGNVMKAVYIVVGVSALYMILRRFDVLKK